MKYTIDYPRIELHPLDTRKFKVYYADKKIDAKYEFNKCIEMKALSRQSRDLIALAIKCFSAQTYFVTSKIIENIANEPHRSKKSATFSVSEVLLELEFIKRELYAQINLASTLSMEKSKLSHQVVAIEEEM